MLHHINQYSDIYSLTYAKNVQHILFLSAYGEDLTKERIFGLKKCAIDAVAWAVDNIVRIITHNVANNITDIRRKIPSRPKGMHIGLVPIPSRGYYKREKDSNHMLVVAKEIRKKMTDRSIDNINIHILDCLIPLSLTQQKKLSKENREKRSTNMFTIDPIIKLFINRKKYTHVWVIDDVITTGSTLSSASELIMQHIKHEKLYALGLTH